MFEIRPNSNLKNFTEKSAKWLDFGVFRKKKFCLRMNRNVGKRGENLIRNTKNWNSILYCIVIVLAHLLSGISRVIYIVFISLAGAGAKLYSSEF